MQFGRILQRITEPELLTALSRRGAMKILHLMLTEFQAEKELCSWVCINNIHFGRR